MFGRGALSTLDWLPEWQKRSWRKQGIGVWVYASDHPAAAPRLIPHLGVGSTSEQGWTVGCRLAAR